jgi:aryl-alcohol dehydrogenase-like predicted oxidoreductase
MQYRTLGQTNLNVSILGFGCGAVGGLLVRGDYPQMRRTVARAIELGVNYFDTASLYGNGQSEVNLGAVLRELDAEVIVGTKVRLAPADLERIEAAVIQSVESSLQRMGRESVDLIQYHNRIEGRRQAGQEATTPTDLESVFNAFSKLQQQGKVRHWGITGLGETEALHHVVAAGGFHTIQSCYNLLNPSAGAQTPPNFPFQNYRQLIDRCATQNIGVIVIRALAAGALSGSAQRHANAAQQVDPIATSPEFAADVARAQVFNFLVAAGYCTNLIEAALRFVISKPAVSTSLIGISSYEQLEQAVASVEHGALPAEVLERLTEVWTKFAAV